MSAQSDTRPIPTIEQLITLEERTGVSAEHYLQLLEQQRADAEVAAMREFYDLPATTPAVLVWRWHRNAMNNGASQEALEQQVIEDALQSNSYSVFYAIDASTAAFINDWMRNSKMRSNKQTL